MKRTPLKRNQKPLKRSGLKKISKKGKIKVKKNIERGNEMRLFFYSLWSKRPHECQSCSSPLGHEPHSYNFDHLLEKSKYPDLAFNEDNIFICCLDCHTKKTNGHPTEKHLEAINKAKEQFL